MIDRDETVAYAVRQALVHAQLDNLLDEDGLDDVARQMAEYLAPEGVAEVAEHLGIRRPNVRKMLARHDAPVLAELVRGPIYARGAIEDVRERFRGDG